MHLTQNGKLPWSQKSKYSIQILILQIDSKTNTIVLSQLIKIHPTNKIIDGTLQYIPNHSNLQPFNHGVNGVPKIAGHKIWHSMIAGYTSISQIPMLNGS